MRSNSQLQQQTLPKDSNQSPGEYSIASNEKTIPPLVNISEDEMAWWNRDNKWLEFMKTDEPVSPYLKSKRAERRSRRMSAKQRRIYGE